MVAKLGICKRCLQYKEDCECCSACGGSRRGDHFPGCDDATTDLVRKRPRVVVRVDADADGTDSTG